MRQRHQRITPFCPGLVVILTFPFSVSTIAPFVMMFLLVKKMLAGFSITEIIFRDVVVFSLIYNDF